MKLNKRLESGKSFRETEYGTDAYRVVVTVRQYRSLRDDKWKSPEISVFSSPDTSIERAELLAAALAEAIELAKEWDRDTGKE